MDEKEMRILLVENNSAYVRRIRDYLHGSDGTSFDLKHDDRLGAGMARLDEESLDVVLLGLSLPDSRGLDSLERLQQYTLDTPVIVLAGPDDEALALKALAAGAQDYLFIEQIGAEALIRSIRYSLERHRDLRERAWAEEALRKVNRARDVISESNRALVRAAGEEELLQDVCDIVVERGGYVCAWIAYPQDDESRPIEPVARAGGDLSSLLEQTVGRAGTEENQDPTLTALRTGQPALLLDAVGDPPSSGRPDPPHRDVGSILALPLNVNGETIGALTICASRPEAFDVEERKLLHELAEDVAYGIDTLRVRARQQEAEEQLAESRQRLRQREAYYRALIENTTDIVTVVGRDGVIRDETPSVEKVLGYTPEEMVGKPILDFVHPDDAFRVRSFLSLDESVPDYAGAVQFRFRHKDGSWLHLEAVANDLIDEPAVGGIVINSRDVTGRQRAEEALRRSNERLTVLREVEQAILSARSPEETAKAALSRMSGLIPYDRASVTLFDLEDDEVRLLAIDGRHVPDVDVTTAWARPDFGALDDLQRGRHSIVHDLRERAAHARIAEQLMQAGLRTLLNVPLLTSQKLLGSLNMAADSPAAFDHNHVQIAYEVAGSLAIAIQNAQLLQEAQQQATQLAGLYDTALNITGALDKETLLNRLAAQLQEMLAPDAIGVVLYDRPAGEVEVALAREHGEPVAGMIGRRLPLSEAGLSGWVIRQKRSLLIRDMNADPLPETPQHTSRPAVSWLGVPLLGREQTLGAMSVQSLQAHAFGDEDVRLLESMAAQVAVALQNAQLYGQARRRAQELEALEKVSSALRVARERDEMFDAMLHSLYELLQLESAGVILRDPQTADWVVASVVGHDHGLKGASWSADLGLTPSVLE
ncbi:MAG: GAF domain-containing protein, partial [Candidatus Promineifilaceae bacterium]|nr:GAF domain-containing protein [Candidatus Promineifilaceae bacterium]